MKKILRRYAYVRACMIDEMVSFDHCWVSAVNEDDAYLQGVKAMPVTPERPPLNDYVFLAEPQLV
jgi:hypothetical protein